MLIPTLDLGSVVAIASCTISVKRFTGSGYDEHGVYVSPDPEVLTMSACVQPPRESSLRQAPEGRRIDGEIMIYSVEPLYSASVAEQRQPDVVEWNGAEYEVTENSDRTTDGGYYRARAVRKDLDDVR